MLQRLKLLSIHVNERLEVLPVYQKAVFILCLTVAACFITPLLLGWLSAELVLRVDPSGDGLRETGIAYLTLGWGALALFFCLYHLIVDCKKLIKWLSSRFARKK